MTGTCSLAALRALPAWSSLVTRSDRTVSEGRHSTTLTASPPRVVSLNLVFASASASASCMLLMRLTWATRCLPSSRMAAGRTHGLYGMGIDSAFWKAERVTCAHRLAFLQSARPDTLRTSRSPERVPAKPLRTARCLCSDLPVPMPADDVGLTARDEELQPVYITQRAPGILAPRTRLRPRQIIILPLILSVGRCQ